MAAASGKKRARITRTRVADANNVVHTLKGGGGGYRRAPCEQCPWRVDRTGSFPAEAFRHSANTAYDASFEKFACHMSGVVRPATCAGFLLRNSVHNLGVRISMSVGAIDIEQVSDGGLDLHASYRAMAVANGVAPDDPILALCRGDRS